MKTYAITIHIQAPAINGIANQFMYDASGEEREGIIEFSVKEVI